MRKTWAVVKREFGAFVGTKAFFLGTLFGPLALLVLLALPEVLDQAGEAEGHEIVVVAPSESPAGRELAADLGAPSAAETDAGFRIEIVRADAEPTVFEGLRRQVLAGRLDGFVVLPAGPDDAIVFEGRPMADFDALAQLRAAAERAVRRERLMAAGIEPDAAERALAPVSFEMRALGAREEASAPPDQLLGLVFYLNTMTYVVILLYGISVLRSVQEEKERRIVEVLLSSLRPGQLMTGKVLGIGAAGLLQVAIWIAFATVALTWGEDFLVGLGMSPPSIPHVPASLALVVLVFFAGGYFLYASLYAALGAIAASWQDAQNLQFPALLVLMAAFFTTFPAIENPESGLAVATSLIPFSSPLVVPARYALGVMSWSELVLPAALLIAGCAVLLWAAGRIFRVTILAAGARPTPRRIWRWLRTG